MANPADVLYQLQGKLSKHFTDDRIKVNTNKDLDEDLNEFGLASNLIDRLGVDGSDVDVDNVNAVDTPYKTNMGIPAADSDKVDYKNVKVEKMISYIFEKKKPEEEEIPPEQSQEEIPPEGAPEQSQEEIPPEQSQEEMPPEGAPEQSQEEMPPEGAENMAGAEGMPPEGMPPEGMPEEEAKTPSEIGRIYELKKIYTRLTTIESYLSDTSDTDLLRIRLLVSKSIELFEILSSNIPSYRPPKAKKETIDEIIVMYYKFLKQVYESVAKHYKDIQNKVLNTDKLKKTTISLSKKELL